MPRRAQFLGETGGVAIDDVDPRIVGKLPFEIARKGGIQFEEEQLRIRHPSGAASSREWTPSPGPYSAMMRGWLKSILLATRSTSALELGMMEAI